MSRRVSLPGADELFRTTGPAGVPDTATGATQPPAGLPQPPVSAVALEQERVAPDTDGDDFDAPAATGLLPRVIVTRRSSRNRDSADRRSTGRERHEEKITVYVSSEELFDLEHARLVLRGEHHLVIDRGRIVREALAVVLADLEAKGGQSILVRRLRGD
jgi:hypothetical protein